MPVNYRTLFNHFKHQPCLLCDADTLESSGLCQACRQELPLLQHSCLRCGHPLSGEIPALQCGSCQKKPPPLSHTWALLEYQGPVVSLIQGLKFGSQLHIARSLGELMAHHCQAEPPEALLPVPLHARRLRQRGYNQALELARPLARHFNLPLLKHVVSRTRATTAQAELPAEQRRKNLRGAFAQQQPLPYSHIALVDDVMTSGNTLFELARLLKKAGVARVDAWVCARAT